MSSWQDVLEKENQMSKTKQAKEFAMTLDFEKKPLRRTRIHQGGGRHVPIFKFYSYCSTFGEERHPGAETIANYLFGKENWEWKWECSSDIDTTYLILTKSPGKHLVRKRWAKLKARIEEITKGESK